MRLSGPSAVAAIFLLTVAGGAAGQPAPTSADCLACHEDPSLARSTGSSVAVDPKAFAASIHGPLACIDCHTGLARTTEYPHPDRVAPVDCGACHGDAVTAYQAGVHAEVRRKQPGSPAATCVDCHGVHDIRASTDPASRTHHLNLPATCGRCHGDPRIIARGIRAGNVFASYHDSIHGHALSEAGLVVAPNCSDCHGSHAIKRSARPDSPVHRRNVPATCGRCHQGIATHFGAGIHGQRLATGYTRAPACHDCHTAHAIQRTERDSFQLQAVRECGTCHQQAIGTYRDTFHGKVTSLGFTRVARCANCHGPHEVLPKTDPRSTIAPQRIVSTCRQCHPAANERFARYDPHADQHDRTRNPVLYYAARFMHFLLTGVFAFFATHTGLWLGRSARDRGRRGRVAGSPREAPAAPARHVLRIDRTNRILHSFLMTSFLGLAATGLPLLFSDAPWAGWLARLFGGFAAAGVIHRICATVLLGTVIIHVGRLMHRLVIGHELGLLWGPDSMVPQPRDFVQFGQHVRWFFGFGPRPAFDRFTYWEKFDYWAVFWGIAIIGGSGIVLWFPAFFSKFLPGWVFNVALFVHGEEALLAVGFIFTIHFFNGHLRPSKFPMDTVIFTGRVTEEELAEERPAELARLRREGRLEALVVNPAPSWMTRASHVAGTLAVGSGLVLFVLILYALLRSL